MARAGGNADPTEYLYGFHALREALRAGSRPIVRLLVARQGGQFAEMVKLARAARIPVQVEPRSALDRLVPGGKHQGIIGIVGAKRYADPDEILAYAQGCGEPPCVLILDGVEDPRNLGAILRTAEAAGVQGVFIPERRSAGLTPTVAKASAGALEHLRVASVPNLSRLIEQLQGAGLWVYALDAAAPKPYTALDLRGPIALVFGGEGKGVRQGVAGKCDERAAIPLRGKVASLNVSAAAAIVLFEVTRQRAG
ncbi:MAG: 23S rRNA (guanosine(2251)-2'-O)-methyltransferase RlmB [Nitrospirales bacterium]